MKGFFVSIGKKNRGRHIARVLLLSMLFQLLYPLRGVALTSGPSQEEYASFEPFETNQMVDPYSGDFTYNLPLLTVPGPNGGYPVNLSYHSGITMDQEASWVGLGWNINVGAINRSLRGLPDDMNGLTVKRHNHIKDFYTTSLSIPYVSKKEFFGMEGSNGNPSTQLYYNNYKGVGYRVSYSPNFNKQTEPPKVANASFGLSYDSQGGIGVNTSLSLRTVYGSVDATASLDAGFNSRSGLTSYGISTGFIAADQQRKKQETNSRQPWANGPALNAEQNNFTSSSSLSFPTQFYAPHTAIPTEGKVINFDFKFPIKFLLGSVNVPMYKTKSFQSLWYEGVYEEEKISNGGEQSLTAYGYMHAKNSSSSLNDFERKEITYSKKVPNISPVAFTYDVFSVSGQGVGGMFRPYRNDVGVLHDPEVQSSKDLKQWNLEVGVDPHPPGEAVLDLHLHTGFNTLLGGVNNKELNTSGPWTGGLNISQGFNTVLPNSSSNTQKALYEESYFQMYGEKTALYDNEDILSSTGGNWSGDYPVRAKLYKSGSDYEVDANTNFVATQGGAQTPITSNPMACMPNRKRRANNIEYLTAGQAKQYGVTKTGAYTYSVQGGSSVDKYSGLSSDANDQLSEVVIRQTDGSRYVYGLPAYNTQHIDATFRVDYGGKHTAISPSDVCTSQLCTGNEAQTHYISTNFSSTPGPKTDGIPQALQGTDVNGQHVALDEFVAKTEKPMYAHSWLLTHLLGSDYVDSDGTPGPSAGDYGYWVKFNYKKIASNYQWRIPFHDAAYSPNAVSNPKDNMANYSYGQKEIYVLESIETKTHKAIFYTSNREDGFEANGEFNSISGGYSQVRGTKCMYKLDSVALYTNSALLSTNQADKVSLQTVHMTYDYSLCQGIPNNRNLNSCSQLEGSRDLGKLTLKNLYFTYNGSQRGKLSQYKFNYGEYLDYNGDPQISNPAYDPFMSDRWGNYSPYTYYAAGYGVFPIKDYNGDLPLSGIPYTSQSTAPDAYAWNLTSIETPTGGKIKVEYEPDDYAYVQDKPAQQMYYIRSANNTDPSTVTDYVKSSILPKLDGGYQCGDICSANVGESNLSNMQMPGGSNSSVIYFDLGQTVPAYYTANDFSKMYLNNIAGNKAFFKVDASVNRSDAGNEREFDAVAGYADIDLSSGSYGFARSSSSISGYDLGFVSLKNEKRAKHSNKYVHPFQHAALNYVRINRPENVYQNAYTYNLTSQSGFAIANLGILVGAIPQVTSELAAFNKYLVEKGIGEKIRLSGHSMIRLSSANKKFGGGVRVHRLYIEDSFKTSTANVYGQEYNYTIDENGNTISSGVAYEPQVGGDENALHTPVNYTESHFLKTAINLFLEEPLLDQFYPGPSVGYRKVTIKSIARSNAEKALYNSPNNEPLCEAQPVTVYEYYTPKEFPIYGDQTNLTADAPIKKGFPPIPGLPGSMRHVLARSQGYMVVINDMAGKLRSVTTMVPSKNANGSLNYAQGKILHKEVYTYKTALPYNPNGTNHLDNTVMVMDETGTFKNAKLGETADVYLDANEDKTESNESFINWNMGFNVKYEPPAALALIVVPLPIPKNNHTLIKYKSIVTMKVINRTGILMSKEVYDGQAYNKIDNLVFNAQNGEPIYTRAKNEFNDDIYNFSYPAHLFYDRMNGAYKTFNAMMNLSAWGVSATINSGNNQISFSDNNLGTLFNIGDKLLVNGGLTCYVADKGLNGSTNYIRCIDANGNFIANSTSIQSIRIIESGHKNLQTNTAGGFTTLRTAPFPVTVGTGVITTANQPQYNEVGKCYKFNVSSIPNVLNATAVAYSDDWKTAGTNANMSSNTPYPSASSTGSAINPFVAGLKGIWRPVQQYSFLAQRKQNNYTRNDGTYDLVPFAWNNKQFVDYMNGNLTLCSDAKTPNWYLTNTVTKVSPFGYEIENRDAEGIYSSALYGYKQQLVKATAANAEYRDMLYDGFEDYQNGFGYGTNENHWAFTSTSNLSSLFAHTGRYSLRIASGVNTPLEVKVPVNIDAVPANSFYYSNPNYAFASTGVVTDYDTYNDVFSPRSGNAYEFSCWVRENKTTGSAYYTDKAYKNPWVTVEFYSNAGALIGSSLAVNPYVQTDAKIIEGWQRLVFPFSVPSGAYTMKFKFSNQNTNASSDVYFDDFRVYPAKSLLKSFVYDPITLKYSATLDENNYATYYVYDSEGKLVITKKETKDGIKTISEGRSGSKQ
ncbi:MAG: hypothetical protein JST26_17620 [Bacteroidetes bacterium]|nr:hypothetical protein [Bacteroidota bacterium]